jgi:hypothetical protein
MGYQFNSLTLYYKQMRTEGIDSQISIFCALFGETHGSGRPGQNIQWFFTEDR